jgi:hypothetical protein
LLQFCQVLPCPIEIAHKPVSRSHRFLQTPFKLLDPFLVLPSFLHCCLIWRTAKLDDLGDEFEFLLIPGGLRRDQCIFGLAFRPQSLFKLGVDFFLFELRCSERIVGSLYEFSDAPLKARYFGLKLGPLSAEFFRGPV